MPKLLKIALLSVAFIVVMNISAIIFADKVLKPAQSTATVVSYEQVTENGSEPYCSIEFDMQGETVMIKEPLNTCESLEVGQEVPY